MTSRGNLVNIMTRLKAGRHGVRILAGQDMVHLFSSLSRPALGPTPTPIRWVPATVSSGVKRYGREADHLSPAIVEVFLYPHSLCQPSWCVWVCNCTVPVCFHGVYGSVTALLLYTFMVCIGTLLFIEIRVAEVRRKLYNEALH